MNSNCTKYAIHKRSHLIRLGLAARQVSAPADSLAESL